jgi:predicted RecB family endonuclease
MTKAAPADGAPLIVTINCVAVAKVATHVIGYKPAVVSSSVEPSEISVGLDAVPI